MSEKHIIVQGAMCKCKHGASPDSLKVISHQYEYANDKEGSEKLIGTTKELGKPFKNGMFGRCRILRKTCKPAITEWVNFYEGVTLKNGGKILTEDSKAICAVAGSPCVKITNHGQTAEMSQQNMNNANEDTQTQLNPIVNASEIGERKHTDQGITISVQ